MPPIRTQRAHCLCQPLQRCHMCRNRKWCVDCDEKKATCENCLPKSRVGMDASPASSRTLSPSPESDLEPEIFVSRHQEYSLRILRCPKDGRWTQLETLLNSWELPIASAENFTKMEEFITTVTSTSDGVSRPKTLVDLILRDIIRTYAAYGVLLNMSGITRGRTATSFTRLPRDQRHRDLKDLAKKIGRSSALLQLETTFLRKATSLLHETSSFLEAPASLTPMTPTVQRSLFTQQLLEAESSGMPSQKSDALLWKAYETLGTSSPTKRKRNLISSDPLRRVSE